MCVSVHLSPWLRLHANSNAGGLSLALRSLASAHLSYYFNWSQSRIYRYLIVFLRIKKSRTFIWKNSHWIYFALISDPDIRAVAFNKRSVGLLAYTPVYTSDACVCFFFISFGSLIIRLSPHADSEELLTSAFLSEQLFLIHLLISSLYLPFYHSFVSLLAASLSLRPSLPICPFVHLPFLLSLFFCMPFSFSISSLLFLSQLFLSLYLFVPLSSYFPLAFCFSFFALFSSLLSFSVFCCPPLSLFLSCLIWSFCPPPPLSVLPVSQSFSLFLCMPPLPLFCLSFLSHPLFHPHIPPDFWSRNSQRLLEPFSDVQLWSRSQMTEECYPPFIPPSQ